MAETKKVLLKYHPDRAKRQNLPPTLCHELTRMLNEEKKDVDDVYTTYKERFLARVRELSIFKNEQEIAHWLNAGGTPETLAAEKQKKDEAIQESQKAHLEEIGRLRIKADNAKKVEKLARAKNDAIDNGAKAKLLDLLEEEQELLDSTDVTPGDIRIAQRTIRQASLLVNKTTLFATSPQQNVIKTTHKPIQPRIESAHLCVD